MRGLSAAQNPEQIQRSAWVEMKRESCAFSFSILSGFSLGEEYTYISRLYLRCREDLSTVACLLSVNTTATSTKGTVADGAPCEREAEGKDKQDNHDVHKDKDIARSKQRKQRRCFRYGNYSSYYGYRIGSALEDDPRLSVFERHWFEGRRCIDIGCNDGLITLSVAMRFLCSSIQGIDIDPSLIRKAQRSLGMVQQDLASSVRDEGTTVRNASTQGLMRQSENCPKATLAALHNVTFRHENFVQVDEGEEGSVDMALCLSVSKWIHLNFGDVGLRMLFDKVYKLLSPGGLFLLEPQPWKSYKQAMRKQDMPTEVRELLPQLKLRPDHFQKLLLQEVGFSEVTKLQVGESAEGFNRPLLLFRK
ncbi:hypothetical protein CYMTET_54270 [Cymbomonas tetramitiformis]|uniref:RNA methyltransferase n=1 Tax=Cymbomonas tetramitiformis TaxID=36881 RepID=A0AAE0BH12_9CHLO|nr:hypothetical protein CYMTET_54270 [Cymbomonas tetramitiformis]